MNRSEQLGESSVLTLLIKFSIPAIIAMVVNSLYNVVDRIFVGQFVGFSGITAITVCFPMMGIMMAFFMLIGGGASTLVSIRLGEKNKKEAEQITGNAITLSIIISIIITLLGILFATPLLQAFGASPEVLPYTKEYMIIILCGTIFWFLGFSLNNIIRAEGNPKTAMYTMLIGSIINIALDPLFIVVFKWGIRGAAIATVLSQIISAIWVIAYFFNRKSILHLHMKCLKLESGVVRKILSIGISAFIMQVTGSGIFIIANHMMKKYGGDTAIAAIGIVNSLSMLIMMPVIGITQGMQPIIGYNYGALAFDRVRKTFSHAVMASTIFVSGCFIIIQLFAKNMVLLFNNDPELINLGTYAMRWYFILLPIIGFQMIAASYFMAVGKPREAGLLFLSKHIIFGAAMLVLPTYYQINGIIYSGPVSDFLATLITVILIMAELKKLNYISHEYQTESGLD